MGYRVTCSCGAGYAGQRLSTHQVLSCQRCQRPLFVLPRSPWSASGDADNMVQAILKPRHPWLIWTGTGALLCLLGLGTGWLVITLLRKAPADSTQDNPADYQASLARARDWLSQGQFRRAALELEQRSIPPAASLADQRRWRQTLRQAQLLADLAFEPWQETLRHAAGVPAEEWQAEFGRRFLNKALVFDAEFQRLPNGPIVTHPPVIQGEPPARLVFEDVKLLRRLDLTEKRRLIFGVRLAGIRLEPPGPQWVIRFHPDDAVLLTDAGAAASLSPAYGSAEGQKQLELQARWLADLER
jgi:hypothetical protein